MDTVTQIRSFQCRYLVIQYDDGVRVLHAHHHCVAGGMVYTASRRAAYGGNPSSYADHSGPFTWVVGLEGLKSARLVPIDQVRAGAARNLREIIDRLNRSNNRLPMRALLPEEKAFFLDHRKQCVANAVADFVAERQVHLIAVKDVKYQQLPQGRFLVFHTPPCLPEPGRRSQYYVWGRFDLSDPKTRVLTVVGLGIPHMQQVFQWGKGYYVRVYRPRRSNGRRSQHVWGSRGSMALRPYRGDFVPYPLKLV